MDRLHVVPWFLSGQQAVGQIRFDGQTAPNADQIQRAAFQRSVINAEAFSPQEAVAAGFLDKVVAAEELAASALAIAQQMKKLNMTAHRNTKLKVRKALLETLDQAIEADSKGSL